MKKIIAVISAFVSLSTYGVRECRVVPHLCSADYTKRLVMYSEPTSHDVCAAYSNTNEKIKCLKIISNIKFDSALLSFCNSINGEEDKNQCLKIIINAEVDKHALDACGELANPSKLKCLLAIKNRKFNSNDVAVCKQIETNTETIECLESISR